MRLGRSFLHALAVAVMATAGVACVDEGATKALRDVVVRPRVVVDGTVELSSRTNGRVLINTVTAHAPGARVLASSDASLGYGDVVVDDTDPLFFRYAPSQVGAQEDTERRWSLPEDGGLLRLAFAPAADEAARAAPFDASGLVGHTVVIAGSIAIESGDSADEQRSAGFVAETDPDGTLADGETDPDGTLADGETDPDGTLADSDPDGTLADSDPDGTLADGSTDPDGTPADGDPLVARLVKTPTSKHQREQSVDGAMVGRPQIRVPFTLTVDGTFEHEAWIDGTAVASLDDGEVLPVDVMFAAEVFFDAERLAVLEDLAAEAALVDGGASLQVSAAATARAVDVEVKRGVGKRHVDTKTSARSSSKIVVTGPSPR